MQQERVGTQQERGTHTNLLRQRNILATRRQCAYPSSFIRCASRSSATTRVRTRYGTSMGWHFFSSGNSTLAAKLGPLFKVIVDACHSSNIQVFARLCPSCAFKTVCSFSVCSFSVCSFLVCYFRFALFRFKNK
jgi:hypothetical protein